MSMASTGTHGRSVLLAAMLLWALAACAGDGQGATASTTRPAAAPIRPLLTLDVAALDLPAPAPGSRPIAVAIYLSAREGGAPDAVRQADAEALVRELVDEASGIFAQCDMHLQLEAAEVIALPDRLLDIEGNRRGSWGGHPPHDVQDPELFTYEEHERLTNETRELFAYGRERTGRNTIAAFTVEQIAYYIGDEREGAGGLSFPPNAYHHPDDYPLRNSVLLVGSHPEDDGLPRGLGGRVLAHELGHMLLNTGSHPPEPENLLAFGTALTPAQCAQIEHNRTALYGEAAVPDPGPPSRSGGR